MENQRITISLDDKSGGFETTPDRVRLADLSRFSQDVNDFLRGNNKEVDTKSLEVSIKHGSLAIETMPISSAPQLFADLKALSGSPLLTKIDTKRREIIEKWQKKVRGLQTLAYKISAPFLQTSLIINIESDYHSDDTDYWVDVERYLYGEILDMGGATYANTHIRLESGQVLKVITDKEKLRKEEINRLYKRATLRVTAKYNIQTEELRNIELIEFVSQASPLTDDEYHRLVSRGTEAWKDVKNATEWVDDLRGEEN
jgi:hypothetical protein